MKILIVDDNREDRSLLEKVLRHYGYEVETASDGAQAMEKALQHRFDIIISDILMPGMDGFALCRAVKTNEKLKSIAFVFYSATYIDSGDEKFALSEGADEFIIKPQEPKVFIEILREVIENLEAGKIIRPALSHTEEESVYLKHYNERLVKKLDDKLKQLEVANVDLAAEKERLAVTLRAKERLDVTLRSIGDGVITTDRDGKTILINALAEELTGWTQEEAVGRHLSEVFPLVNERSGEGTGEQCENPIEKVIKTGQAVDLKSDTLLIARDGVKRVIAGNAAALKDEDGNITGMVLVFRDITERKIKEEELQKASKLESVGFLAGGIAHDFNNILAVIMGNINLAKMLTDPEEERFELLTAVETAVSRATSLTGKLLTFSRGGAPIRKTASIAALIRDWTEFALRGSRAKCNLTIQENLWPVEIDERQISQVISSLVMNADQVMPKGGMIEVRAENVSFGEEMLAHGLVVPEGRYVAISIQDQGAGIPKEHLHKVFDPYFTTKGAGSGLGLTASYSIVKKHEGYLAVESEMGVGTTFFIYLPASTQEIQKEAPAREGGKEKPLPGQGRILIMDDDAMVITVLGSLLTRLGYEVALVKDGDEAIRAYQEAGKSGRPFAAVIMDLIIPGGMGGATATKKLIEIDPGVKAIVSSGYSNDPIMANFRQYGFVGCIAKPYDIQTVCRILHEVIKGN